MMTSVPATSTILSFSPKFRIANSLTGSGVRVMTASPTAMTGEEAGPTRAAVSSANPSATAAASRPARAPSALRSPRRPGAGTEGCAVLVMPGLREPDGIRMHCARHFFRRRRSQVLTGVCEADRVTGPAPDGAPPPMPTSARVAVILTGALAAMLLLYAAIAWLGREGLADAVGRARPDYSPDEAARYVLVSTLPYLVLGVALAV